jgi:bacterioferritin
MPQSVPGACWDHPHRLIVGNQKSHRFCEGNMVEIEKGRVIDLLNRILESELAGVIRYTHYSLLVYGYNRIPVVSWLRDQATESLNHAHLAGEMITHLGGYPSLQIGRLLDSHKHDIGKILVESMEHEAASLALYKELLSAVEGRSVMLEEYARQMIYAEELHAGEVDKMLRKPGEVSTTGIGPKTL